MADPPTNEAPHNRGRLVTILIVAILFGIGIIQVFTGDSGYVSASVDGQKLGVAGAYGDPVFVDLDSITGVTLVDSFDFGVCVEGGTAGKTVSGIYSCESFGQYTVHAYTSVDAYIIVSYAEGILVFNNGSKSSTEKIYDQLQAAVAS